MNRAKGVNRLFLVLVLLSVAAPFLLGRFLTNLTFYQSTAVSQAMYFAPVLIYIVLTGGGILDELQLEIPKLSVMVLIVILSMLLQPVMSWLNVFSMFFAENYVASSMLELDGTAVGKNLMYIAIVPALAEEFMFRGVFYHGYRRAGVWKAALCSGLCFGLIHMNLNQFFYAFVLGIIFALLVEATGSVLSTMLAHFLINANSVMLLAVESELESSMGSVGSGGAAMGAAETLAEMFSRQEMLMILGVYTVMALICGAMAYGVLKLIAKWSGRKEHMQMALGRQRKKCRNAENFGGDWTRSSDAGNSEKEVWEEEPTERERIFTPSLFLGIVGAVTYMVVTELLL